MMLGDDDQRNGATSSLERHIQTLLTAIIVALLAWMAATVQTSSVKLAEVSIQVQRLHRTESEVMVIKERLARMETELALIRKSLEGNQTRGN